MVQDTWDTRAVPILEIVARLEATGHTFDLPHVAENLGCTHREVQIEVDRLRTGRYLGGELQQMRDGTGGMAVWDYRQPCLLERVHARWTSGRATIRTTL